MSEKKTVKVTVLRDFQERVYPGEEIMMTEAQAEVRLESGEVELWEEPVPDDTSEEAESEPEDK